MKNKLKLISLALFLGLSMFRSTAFGQISLVRNNAVADYSLQTSQVNTEIGAFLFQNLDTSDYTLQEVTFSVTDFGFPSDRIKGVSIISNGVQFGSTMYISSLSKTTSTLNVTIQKGSSKEFRLVTDVDLEKNVGGPVMPNVGDYFKLSIVKFTAKNTQTGDISTDNTTRDLQKVYYVSATNTVGATYKDFVKLYPNPAIDQFTIESNLEKGQAELIDMQGRVVKTFIVENGSNTVYREGLTGGVYYIRYTGRSTATKIVFQ